MFLTDQGFISPEEGLELERDLFSEGKRSLTIYSRDRPTVSLGRFNPIDEYVDETFAERNGISVVRRMSGGSAIYSDRDQLVFTYVTGRSSFRNKKDSYRTICGCLVDTLSILGIEAEYKPVNDVLVNGRKISGCAQYRDRDTLLHHGTLILRLNPEMMDGVLRPVKDRKYPGLTSVEDALGYVPERKEILKAFGEGFRV